jgi:opacity protein-like surface antigen
MRSPQARARRQNISNGHGQASAARARDPLASVTGRIGYAWDRFLGYVKLGGAFQRSTYSLLVAGLTGATASETRFGWTAGIGGEYAFLDWLTVFVEYDYYDFGTKTSALIRTRSSAQRAIYSP